MELPSDATLNPWSRLVERVGIGKRVGDSLYLHVDAVPDDQRDELAALAARAGCQLGDFNVLKVALARSRVSLLHYPGFFDEGFPRLAASWTVALDGAEVDRRSYDGDANPPVLHRKERMLPEGHPRRAEFEALTAEAEAAGLFRDTAIIGHVHQWEEELRARGLRVEGNRLLRAHAWTLAADEPEVYRHRTALSRRALSTPMQALWRHGYLTSAHTTLDYGCGRGDDLAALRADGLRAEGWDPYFRPDGMLAEADVVNLGFVLNVIEDPDERRHALSTAFHYARRVLAVAALIGGRTAYERFRLYRDGVLTARGTFQKYFTHPELGEYIAEVLGREPVSVGPGLYFVFRTDDDEQNFLERRQRSQGPSAVTAPTPPRAALPLPRARPVRERPARAPSAGRASRMVAWDSDPELVDAFWQACLELGRLPQEAEFDRHAAMRQLDMSPGLILRRLMERHGEATFEAARVRRRGDLSVFFALNLFERRRSSATASERTRADLREFWGAQGKAMEDARALLFSLRDPAVIGGAATAAAAAGLGHLTPGEALPVDARLVNELPPVLRVYIGCAGKLYGEAQDADVVKVHIGSGKVSLMTYDDYEGALIPMLIERVKVDLRRQHVHYFQYGDDFAAQPLYLKSRAMRAGLEGYEVQRAFDARVEGHSQFDWSGYGPPLGELLTALGPTDVPEGMRLTGPSAPGGPPTA